MSNAHSFAVDRGRLFWPDQVEFAVKTCDIESNVRSRCNIVYFKPDFNKEQIGKNIIIHKNKGEWLKKVSENLLCSESDRHLEIS